MASNTARSLKLLRDAGGIAQVVEQVVPKCFIRRDLFGCIDILSLEKDGILLAVQACSATDHARRRTKALAEPRLRQWLANKDRTFEIQSWKKRGAKGKRKLWEVRRERLEITPLLNSGDIDLLGDDK